MQPVRIQPIFSAAGHFSFKHALTSVMLLVSMIVCAACAAGGGPVDLGPPLLRMVYQGTSDERPLVEMKVHDLLDNYAQVDNWLEEPLYRGGVAAWETISPGFWYVTVLRKKLSLPVSDLIALTTSEPIDLLQGLVEVWVFDESFRIFEAKRNPNRASTSQRADFRR